MKHELKGALDALLLAAQCGGEQNAPVYKAAHAGLVSICLQVLAIDARLNDPEQSPTGDDYNELLAALGLAVQDNSLQEELTRQQAVLATAFVSPAADTNFLVS